MSTDLVPTTGQGPLTWLPVRMQQAWFGDRISVETGNGYMRDGWHWITWCHHHGVIPLEATPAAVRAWIAHQRTGEWRPPGQRRIGGDKESTIARRVSSVANLYRFLRAEGATLADPLAGVTRPRSDEASDAHVLGLDAAVAARLLAAADKHSPRMAALTWLLTELGLRISEAINTDVTAITMQRGHRLITVLGKGRRTRTNVIPPSAWARLEAYLGDRTEGPIFLNEAGTSRWTRQDAWESLRRLGRRVGITRLHPHLLRHTTATLALDGGADIDRVAGQLGHRNLQTTMRYVRARARVGENSPAYDVARVLATAALLDEGTDDQ